MSMITTLAKVKSSMVYAVGYDADNQELELVFNSGKIFQYKDVPPDVYEELMKASSIGCYVRNNIFDCYDEW